VEKILAELELGDRPRLVVFNKIDRMTPEEVSQLVASARKIGEADPLAISARDPHTLTPLFLAMERALWADNRLRDRASFETSIEPDTSKSLGHVEGYVVEHDPSQQ
jgi:GTP-binding protein HflX